MPADGGDAEQITTSGGTLPHASVDGRDVFYAPHKEGVTAREIWKAPVEGGQPVRVTGPTHNAPFAFEITAEGVYYEAPPHSGDQRYIRFFRFSTGQSRPVAVTNRPFVLGMSISLDGKYLLYDQIDQLGSDLMLVENFRPR
jgi:hypothetical protein